MNTNTCWLRLSAFVAAAALCSATARSQDRRVLGLLDAGPTTPGVESCQVVDSRGDLDGDGIADVVGGLPYAPNGGRVVVISGATGGIVRTFLASNPGERFGWSLAVIGDLDGDGTNDILIGAPTAPSGGRVEARSGATGAVLYGVSVPAPGTSFGHSLSVSADVDGDGIPDFIVGAPVATYAGNTATLAGIPTPAGRALVISGATGSTITTFLGASLGASASSFGASVLGAGDLDGDGTPDFVVSSTADHHGIASPTRVISGATGSVIRDLLQSSNFLTVALASPGDVNGDGVPDIAAGFAARCTVFDGANGSVLWNSFTLGTAFSVDALADVNGDGVADLVFGGGTSANGVGITNGRTVLLSGSNGALLQMFLPQAGELSIGFAVAGTGDLDADGIPDFVTLDPTAVDAGRIYAVSSATGLVIGRLGGDSGIDLFGHGLDVAGDFDGDGKRDLAVGSPLENVGSTTNAGRVRIMSTATGAVLRTFQSPVIGETLGKSIADLGDVDGDGVDDFAVGAPATFTPNLTSPSTGRVVVFSGQGSAVLWSVSSPVANQDYGYAVARIADRDGDGIAEVAIGVPSAPVFGAAQVGRVEIRSGASGALLATTTGGLAGDRYGVSLGDIGDIDGDGTSDYAVGASQVTLPSLMGSPGFLLPPSTSPPGYLELRSGATGSILRTVTGFLPGSGFAQSLSRAGDFDGDGSADLVVGAPYARGMNSGILAAGRTYTVSGGTGAILQTVMGAQSAVFMGFAVAPAGDIDGDGIPDFATTSPGGSLAYLPSIGFVEVFSGATAMPLGRWTGTPPSFSPSTRYGERLVQLDDLDGNGIRDLAASSPSGSDTRGVSSRGIVELLSPTPVVQPPPPFSAGCAYVTQSWQFSPAIDVIGIPAASTGNPFFGIRVRGAQPSAPVYLAVGLSFTSWLGTPLPLSLAPLGYANCTLDVSPDLVFGATSSATVQTGSAFFPFPLAVTPGLVGATVYAQALATNPVTASPPGATSPAHAITFQ